MIGYAMVGASDLQSSTAFYDALLAPLGLEKVELDAVYTAYAPKTAPGDVEFYVTTPFDQNAATAGNGSMVAFKVDQRRSVDLFHQIGLENRAKMRAHRAHAPQMRQFTTLMFGTLTVIKYVLIAKV